MEKTGLPGRDLRLDNLKGLLIFLVVFGHLLELLPGGERLWLYRVIYLFHMPAFVFCSGYFARFSLRRMWRIAVPYVLFQTLYELFAVFVLDSRGEHPFLRPYWLMWYLFSLLLWSLTVPLLQRWKTKKWLLPAAVLLSLLSGGMEHVGYAFSLGRTLGLLPFFVGGYLMGHREKKPFSRREFAKKLTLSAFLAVGSALLLRLFEGQMQSRWLYYSWPYAAAGYDVCIRALLLLFGAGWTALLFLISSPRRIPGLSRMGENTLPVFLLHGFLVKLLGKTGAFRVMPFGILAAAALALILCLLLAWPQIGRICALRKRNTPGRVQNKPGSARFLP